MPAPTPMPTKPQFASLAGPTRSATGWANVKWVVLSRLSRRYVVLRSCMLEIFDDTENRTPLLSVCVCGGTLSTVPSRREVIMKADGQRVVVQWATEREFRACIAAFNYANRDIEDFYKLVQQRQLGRGRASDIVFGFDVTTGVHTAVKVVSKHDTRPTERLFAEREVSIRSSVQHPAIVQTLDIFEKPSSLYLVMEFMSGGALHRKMLSGNNSGESIKPTPLLEADARIIMARLFCALRHIHSRGIVHRNVKPDNILLDNTEDAKWPETAKLADLSLACRLDDAEASVGVVGTPDFLAPEATCMVTTPNGHRQVLFGTEVDMWAAGVTLYNILSGELPFDADSPSDVLRKVRNASFDFSPPAFAHTSHLVRSLICALLNPDRRRRLTAAAALQHPWFTAGAPIQPTAQPRPAPRKSKRGVGGAGTKGGGSDLHRKVIVARFKKLVTAVCALHRFQKMYKAPGEPPSVAPPPQPKLAGSKTSRSSAGSAGTSSGGIGGSGGGGGGGGTVLFGRSKSLAISTAHMSSIPSFVSAIDMSPRRPRTRTPPVISRVSNSSTVGTRSSASDDQRAPSPGPGWRTKQVEAFARAGSYRREERGNEIPFHSMDKIVPETVEERRRIMSSVSAGNIGVRVLQTPTTPTPTSSRTDRTWGLRDAWEQRSAQ